MLLKTCGSLNCLKPCNDQCCKLTLHSPSKTKCIMDSTNLFLSFILQFQTKIQFPIKPLYLYASYLNFLIQFYSLRVDSNIRFNFTAIETKYVCS